MARGTFISSKLRLWLGLSMLCLTPACGGIGPEDGVEGPEGQRTVARALFYKLDGVAVDVDDAKKYDVSWDDSYNTGPAPDVDGTVTIGYYDKTQPLGGMEFSAYLPVVKDSYNPEWNFTSDKTLTREHLKQKESWPNRISWNFLSNDEASPRVRLTAQDRDLWFSGSDTIDTCLAKITPDLLAQVDVPADAKTPWAGWITVEGSSCVNSSYTGRMIRFRIHLSPADAVVQTEDGPR
ncbi:MAG: hypothetical protein IT371_20215 [Deltaproteobacteria bacterium]|nr:hypothetical protein [Deltaproteobacteria bacterium]